MGILDEFQKAPQLLSNSVVFPLNKGIWKIKSSPLLQFHCYAYNVTTPQVMVQLIAMS